MDGTPAATPDKRALLLASDYTVVATVPDSESFFHDPAMALLPGGDIFAACPCWKLHDYQNRSNIDLRTRSYLQIATSSDAGRVWNHHDRLPYSEAVPFVAQGALYMFVQRPMWNNIELIKSDDQGKTWTRPVQIFEGKYWDCSTAMAVKAGSLYWAMNATDWKGMVAIAADLSKNLLDKSAWRMSEYVACPNVPNTVRSHRFPPREKHLTNAWGYDGWMEPNVYLVNQAVRFVTRMHVDEQSTANLAALGEIVDKDGQLELKFKQFYGWPGGQNKLFILFDETSGLFWMLCNLASDSMDSQGINAPLRAAGYMGSMGNERRTLALYYGVDGLNWLPAGLVAHTSRMLQSFMYPSAAIQGDDLIFTSRTSRNGMNQHDADLTTFHRIKDFRSLALDLRPKPAEFSRLVPPMPLYPRTAPVDDGGDVIGRWMWMDGTVFSFKKSGEILSSRQGIWRALADGIEVDFDKMQGTLSLVGDGTLLQGQLSDGSTVWAVRQPVH